MSFDDILEAWFAFKKKIPPVPREFVKLFVPSAGVFALYLGGLLGIFLVSSRSSQPPSWLAQLFWAALLGLGGAFVAMLCADSAIGKEADHVDLLKTLWYMGVAAFAVLIERLIGERLGWALPQFLENLAIWGAGIASIWEEEPGFPGWKTALSSLKLPEPPK
jgi:hypothetical protein